MNFYAAALGGQIVSMQRFGDAPMPTDEATKNQVMHATMQAGEIYIMASDSGGKQEVHFGDNVHLSVNCSSEEEINRVFAAMAEGGGGDDAAGRHFLGSAIRDAEGQVRRVLDV